MWEEREPLFARRYYNKSASAKSNKKANITLSIDTEIQNALKNAAEAEG